MEIWGEWIKNHATAHAYGKTYFMLDEAEDHCLAEDQCLGQHTFFIVELLQMTVQRSFKGLDGEQRSCNSQ